MSTLYLPPPGVQVPPGPRRPWSARRVTAAVTAALVALASGLLLFEAVWTRSGNRANAWWTTLSGELATRPVDDVWILTGAAVTAALGLGLLVLALTPGLRRRLPLKAPAGSPAGMRVTVDRASAALLVRDAAMRVPGISAARVHAGRRRMSVRADVRFNDLAEVRGDLTETVRRTVSDQLPLAHTPKLRIRVRRGRS